MDSKELCPICGEGQVKSQVDQVETDYKGRKAMVPLHYQLCDTCHSDFAGAKESRQNKRAVLAFRKSVDGLLTGAEICALREKYKLTQSQAARLFGGGPVAFSKYENDDVSQSESMDSLLRLIRRCEVAFWELVDEKGMTAELKPAEKMDFNERVITVTVPASNVVSMATFRANSVRTSARTHYTVTSDDNRLWR